MASGGRGPCEDLVLERARVGHVHGHRSRERRVARRVARTRRQRVRAVRHRTGIPRQRVRRSGILESGVDTVNEELHTGDTDVVTRVCGDIYDVEHLGVARGRGDRNRWRCLLAGAAGEPECHVRLDLGQCQCPAVDADVVEATVGIEATETWTPADVDVGRRVLLRLEVTVPSSVPSSSWPFRYTCSWDVAAS